MDEVVVDAWEDDAVDDFVATNEVDGDFVVYY